MPWVVACRVPDDPAWWWLTGRGTIAAKPQLARVFDTELAAAELATSLQGNRKWSAHARDWRAMRLTERSVR